MTRLYRIGVLTGNGLLVLLCTLIIPASVAAQHLFTEEGQVFALEKTTRAFLQYGVDPSNGAIRMTTVNPDIGVPLDAIGYRRTDRLIYGIHTISKHLYRVDAAGTAEDMGSIGLDPTFDYLAGDISPNGKTYILIASVAGADRRMLEIDLSSPGYPITLFGLSGQTNIQDLAFDPTFPQLLYGYDAAIRTVVKIDLNAVSIAATVILLPTDEMQSVFFDAFGRLYGFGTSIGGVAGTIFNIDKGTGVPDISITGPVTRIADMADVPYAVEMEIEPSARVSFPCSELTFTVSIANRTDTVRNNLNFTAELPAGFTYNGLVTNGFGGTAAVTGNTFQLSGMTIPRGTGMCAFKLEVGDVPEGNHYLQGQLSGLPPRYGSNVLSDDPITPQWEDATHIKVNRITEDSIIFSRFLCIGDTAFLDGSPYGAQVHWNTGSSNPQIGVTTGGTYIAEASGGCESVVIVFHVTVATCPFTVEVDHEMIPPETLPCSEVLFTFRINNDSGTRRDGLTFTDTLPDGIDFVAIENNPFGGQLDNTLLPGIIRIDGMSMEVGVQSLDVRVAVGNIPPGSYPNQAILRNLPQELGPFRLSDNPATPQLDATPLEVLGVETDTLYVDEILCEGSSVVLDGEPYGINYLWDDQSTESYREVYDPGTYELTVFDGCEPTYIFFEVMLGAKVDVAFDSAVYHIRLGDSLTLAPRILNAGNQLYLSWISPLGDSLTCDTCAAVSIFLLFDAAYRVFASNEDCTDSAVAKIVVDKTRHIFVPNIFTPNYDGINDFVSVFSPEFGQVETFAIMDRWGSVLNVKKDFIVNTQTGWDGIVNGKEAPAGTYVWNARIRFLDGITESFAGTVTILR